MNDLSTHYVVISVLNLVVIVEACRIPTSVSVSTRLEKMGELVEGESDRLKLTSRGPGSHSQEIESRLWRRSSRSRRTSRSKREWGRDLQVASLPAHFRVIFEPQTIFAMVAKLV